MSRMISETVEMTVRVKVRYERDTDGARQHILEQLPGLVAHVNMTGCSATTGSYGARIVGSTVVSEAGE